LNWKMANAREAFGEALLQLGREDERIVALNADLSSSTKTNKFAKEFPERFFNAGIAEQNMMGMAAGLATTGKIPVASTFAVFATGRVYDIIRQSIAYPRLNVKIVATHAGITVGGDGASHQITEDIALMRVLPNMRIVVPADAVETVKAFRSIVYDEGPFYMRLGRSDTPVVFDEGYEFTLGKASTVEDGEDVAVIATGIMLSRALEAREMLEDEGISARVLNMSTIKPLDRDAVVRAARDTKGIVTAEEHSIIGGLGGAVAEVCSREHPTRILMVGVEDTFGQSGDAEGLMRHFKLTPERIVEYARKIVEG